MSKKKDKTKKISCDIEFVINGIVPSKQASFKVDKVLEIAVANNDTKACTDFKEKILKNIEDMFGTEGSPNISDIIPSKARIFVILIQFFREEYPYNKRDIDNMAKLVLDVMKGHLYVDDNQISELFIHKRIEKKIKGDFMYIGLKKISSDQNHCCIKEINIESAFSLGNN